MERVRVKMMRIKAVGAACSLLPMHGFSPPQAVILTLNRQTDCGKNVGAGPRVRGCMRMPIGDRPPGLIHGDRSLLIHGLWLPHTGTHCLQRGKVQWAAILLSDGRLTLSCVRRCQAHLPHCALRSLTRKQLRLPSSSIGGAWMCLGG